MTKLARVVASSMVLGLILALIWLCWPRSRRESRRANPPVTAISGDGVTGSETMLLDTFAPDGRPGWHLELAKVVVGADRVVHGTGVSARFYGTTPPATLEAAEIICRPDRARLLFNGGVRLQGPGIALTAPELAWDDRTRSFSIEGRYVLAQGGTVLRGEKLWADEGFREVRALGAVKLETTSDGGGKR